MQLGGLGLFGPGGTAAALALRGEVAVTERLWPTVNGGLLRTFTGDLRLRDLQVGARWLPVRGDTLVVAVEPGLSLPLGSVGADAGFLPTTSGSVDPTLKADVVVGAQWLALAGVQARAPVVDGRDGVRQGPFARADLRGAARFGDAVPFVGASVLRQAPHADGRGAFSEVAASAGVSLTLGERTGLGASLRVPLWTDATERYALAPAISLRQVLGKRADDQH